MTEARTLSTTVVVVQPQQFNLEDAEARAHSLCSIEDFTGCKAVIQTILDVNPNHALSISLSGFIEFKRGNNVAAAQLCERSLLLKLGIAAWISSTAISML